MRFPQWSRYCFRSLSWKRAWLSPALSCPAPWLEGPPWVGSKPRYGTCPWFKAARRPGPLAHSCLRASENLIVEKGPGHPYHLPTPWPPPIRGRSSQLTRYSNTRVRDRSVWMRSCRVTILACFRFFSRDTTGRCACLGVWCPTCPSQPLFLASAQQVPTSATTFCPQAPTTAQVDEPLPPGALGCYTLSDGSAGRPLLMLQPDLLQGHEVLCQFTAPLEDCGIGALGTRAPQPQPDSGSALLCSVPPPCASAGAVTSWQHFPLFSLHFSVKRSLTPPGQSALSFP